MFVERMGILDVPSPDDISRDYTRRQHVAGQFQFLGQFIAITAYGYFGLQDWPVAYARTVTSNFWLQLAICWTPLWVTCTAFSVPVSLYRLHLNVQFGRSKGKLSAWMLSFFKANAFGFVLDGLLLEFIFLSHITSLRSGWILAAVLCSLLFMGISESFPWLMSFLYTVHPLRDETLRTRLVNLAHRAGLNVRTIYQWRKREANALVSGIGIGRRITLTDTLLRQLSQDEVEAIVAHELGHCAMHHVFKRLVLQSVVFCALFWIINVTVRYGIIWFASEDALPWTDLRLLPGVFFLWSIGRGYGSLIVAVLARKQEREADLFGWRLMGGSGAFVTGLKKMTDLNLIVYDRASEWKYTHPATADRITAAEQFMKDPKATC